MSRDFIIIGGGIIGLSTALELLRRNMRVTILERGTTGHESSWAGGGILSALLPWDYEAPVNNLINLSTELFPKWIADIENETGVDTEFITSGMLVIPPFNEEKLSQYALTHNLETQKIDLKSTTYKIQLDQTLTPLWLPRVKQIRNPRLLHALKQAVLLAKGEIREYEEVQEWQKTEGTITGVVTPQGQYSANHYVVSAGAWSQNLLSHYTPPEIRPVRGQMLLFKLSAPLFSPIIFQDGFYLIPRKDGHVVVGSTLEDTGFDKSTTPEAKLVMLEKAKNLFPQLNEKTLIQHWAGLRPASPNNIPTIGKHPYIKNLYINSGHFRYGLTMAPGSAEILVNSIFNLPQPIDISLYAWNSGTTEASSGRT